MRINKPETNEYGQSMLESVLMISVLVPFLLMMVQVGVYLYFQNRATQIAAAGAREISQSGSPERFNSLIDQMLSEVYKSSVVVSGYVDGESVVSLKLINPSDYSVIEDIGPQITESQNPLIKGTGMIEVQISLDLPKGLVFAPLGSRLTSVNAVSRLPLTCVPNVGEEDCI